MVEEVCVFSTSGGGTGMVNVKKFNVSFDLFATEQGSSVVACLRHPLAPRKHCLSKVITEKSRI